MSSVGAGCVGRWGGGVQSQRWASQCAAHSLFMVLMSMFCSSSKIYFCLILSRFCWGCNGEFCGVGVHIPGSAMRALPEVMSMEGSAMVFS